MAQDHYVAETYLKAFADPTTIKDPKKGIYIRLCKLVYKSPKKGGQIHAYRKSDGKSFFPFAGSICKTLDWDQTPKYLSPPDALGQWLKIYEPHWASAVGRLSTTSHLSPSDIFLIAGYWAYLSTCTPTWQRVTAAIQQADLEGDYLDRSIAHVTAHPEQYPKAERYLPLVKEGKLKVTIDKNYPKAIVITQLLQHQWCLYHQEWNVIYNNVGAPFITNDNPSCFDYKYGSAMHPARYFPLTPKLALWANVDLSGIPDMKRKPDIEPIRKSVGKTATAKFVKDMNVLIVQSAENVVLSPTKEAYIEVCVRKYRNWCVARAETIRIPDLDGYYEVIQTRACPKSANSA
jgi:hypothetical protein